MSAAGGAVGVGGSLSTGDCGIGGTCERCAGGRVMRGPSTSSLVNSPGWITRLLTLLLELAEDEAVEARDSLALKNSWLELPVLTVDIAEFSRKKAKLDSRDIEYSGS